MYPARPLTRAATLALLLAVVAAGLAIVPAAAVAAPSVADGAGSLEDGESQDDDANDTIELDASVTADEENESVSADADATVESDDTPASVGADADTTVESDDDTVASAGVDADAAVDEVGASVGVDADVNDSLSANATVAAADGSEAGPTVDPAHDGAEPRTAGSTGGDGDGDEDADAGPEGDDGRPGDAGTGLAVGSLLVGGGLLGRRAVAASAAPGSAGASTLSWALGLLRAWWWRVLAVVGYQRYEDSDPLEQETRAAVHAHLRESPGVSRSELSEAVDVPVSTLRYHLRVLAFEDLLTSETVRGKRRYFPADAEPEALEPALADEATAAVLEALATAPDSVSGLADRLDRDPSTVSHHLQRLDEAGLVERERQGRSVINRLADHVDETAVEAATAATATTSAD